MLSFSIVNILCCHLCYHFLMLSFDVIIWCYHLVLSFILCIILCYHFSQFANVIIFVLSFFLVQDGCYHLCCHLMLSFFDVIIWCYHYVLSFGVIIWCYHLFYVIF
jgi:hypothetical protein